jgi:GYF domain 2
MNYFISREGMEYGPYTLADLQRYVASGNVLVTDLARSEGMSDWMPVSQVIGNIPVPVMSVMHPPESTLGREGKKLVVPRGTSLPHYCVKCGKPAEGPDLQKNFAWLNPLLGLLVLGGCIGIIVYIVLYYAMRKQMTFGVPLCEEHQRAIKKKLWLGGGLTAAGPVLIVIAALVDKPEIAAFGILLLLVGAIVLVLSPPLRPKKIDDAQGLFAGAGEAFLNIIESQGRQAAGTGY